MEISESTLPHLKNQCELNDLVRDLKLTKEQSELLGSRLKQWNLLEEGTKSSVFRTLQEDFSIYFEMYNTLCFCNNTDALMGALGVQNIPSKWRIFIDSSKSSIKAVLLHNDNLLLSIPIAYSENLRESQETMVIGLFLGMQPGYTKYCCFICEWDSRARQCHYIQKDWPLRDELIPAKKCVSHHPLVDPKKVLCLPYILSWVLLRILLKQWSNTTKKVKVSSTSSRNSQKLVMRR